MQTMHPTLLIGPADWDPARLPREEYAQRLAKLWTAHPQAGGAIVHGHPSAHAELAYLTHLTPKLEAAFAFIPREGKPRLLIGGGANMVPAARRLTFVDDLAPLRDPARTAADWAGGLPSGSDILLIGGGAMSYDLRCKLDAAFARKPLIDADSALRDAMRTKSPRELALLRASCAILRASVSALRDAFRDGRSVSDCLLAAEHTAIRQGAQDVRSLFGFDGKLTLRPFTSIAPGRADRLQAYLAVRHDGYWAEIFVPLSTTAWVLAARVQAMAQAMAAAVKPGMTPDVLCETANAERGAFASHPLMEGTIGHSVGLALDEAPLLASGGLRALRRNEVYSLHAGASDGNSGAISSVTAIVTDSGCEVVSPPA